MSLPGVSLCSKDHKVHGTEVASGHADSCTEDSPIVLAILSLNSKNPPNFLQNKLQRNVISGQVMHLGGEEGGVEGVTRTGRYYAHRELESRPPVWPIG